MKVGFSARKAHPRQIISIAAASVNGGCIEPMGPWREKFFADECGASPPVTVDGGLELDGQLGCDGLPNSVQLYDQVVAARCQFNFDVPVILTMDK